MEELFPMNGPIHTFAMHYFSTILLFITVVITVVILRTVIFGEKNNSGKFPCMGLAARFWIVKQMFTKRIDELLQHPFLLKDRTFWIKRLTRRDFCTRDLRLIKLIFVQNFRDFPNRVNYSPTGDIIFDKSILHLQSPNWKTCRSALSPIFTISKLKKMSPLIENCVQSLYQKLDRVAQQGLTVEIKSLLNKHSLSVISVSAFDFSLISTSESKEEFFSHAHGFINNYNHVKIILATWFPWVFRILGISIFSPKTLNYFRTLVKQSLEERRNSDQSESKADLIHLFLKHGKEVVNEQTSKKTREEFSFDEITSNTTTFLLAGYETTASTLCSIIYCLAQNPLCQEKLLEEIETTSGAGTSPADMPYLEAIISETLRLFPPVPVYTRVSVRDCHVDGTFFPKDTVLFIPIYSLHRDPEYFPDPETFLPDRFLTGVDCDTDAYMPFGLGPRKCIGNFFALMAVRMTLIQLVQKFKFVSTQKEFKLKSNCPFVSPEELLVKIEKRV